MNGYRSILAITVFLMLCHKPCFGQQAVINLPSADLTPKGEFFMMNESFLRPIGPDSEWKTTNFFTYGLTHNTELTVTTFNAGLPKTDNFVVGYGLKSVVPLFKKRLPLSEFKLTPGGMVPVSKQGRGVGSYGYAHLSGRLPRTRTRLTAGVTAGTQHIFERDVVAFMGAIEQPLTRNLQAIVEYYSGTHALAGTVLGLVFHHHETDWVVVSGWRIPNNSLSGNPGVIVEIGKFIGPLFHKNQQAHHAH